MYRAKRAQSRCEFFSLDIEDEAPRRLILVTALKRAIDTRSITMHYQPKFELGTRRVVGVEALARWTDPVVGPVLPTTFVPLAERTGLAEPLTELALEIAATDARRWLDDGFNIPGRRERAGEGPPRPELPRPRGGQAARHGPRRERARDRDHGEHAHGRPRRRRARRSPGSATSACAPRSTTSARATRRSPTCASCRCTRSRSTAPSSSDVSDEPGSDAIVRSIIELARNLQLETVAEGVEDERICSLLVGLGCDLAQGFALARPMAAEDMRRWLRARVPTVD